MDEKTAALRDIFIDTTGSETVTERQAESPGSLTEERTGVDERLETLIVRMRERYEFKSDLDDSALAAVIRGYYEELDDREIATHLECTPETVRTARLDLHLVRENDRDAPFDLDQLRGLLVEETPLDACAAELETPVETVARYRDVIAADRRSTRANTRFRDEFAELLTDSDLTGQLATNAREDGLREATEDLETDVSF